MKELCIGNWLISDTRGTPQVGQQVIDENTTITYTWSIDWHLVTGEWVNSGETFHWRIVYSAKDFILSEQINRKSVFVDV